MRVAPRRRAGTSGVERRTPPSPYQSFPRRTAGKNSGREEEAMTWSTLMWAWTLRCRGWFQGVKLRAWTQVTVWPVE